MFVWIVACSSAVRDPEGPGVEALAPSVEVTALGPTPTAQARDGFTAPASQDTAATDETGAQVVAPDTGTQDTGAPPAPPLVARLAADTDDGEYPLVVTFDATTSDLGSGAVRYEWAFGDGAFTAGVSSVVHLYVGKGDFEVTLTLTDELTGDVSEARLEIDVDTPDCPREEDPELLGILDDSLTDLSGVAASRRAPGLYWVLEDDEDDLLVLDEDGDIVSEHDLPGGFQDLEDLAVVLDPETGVSRLFVADIGDNDHVRDEIEVWIADEPDPWSDSDLDPLQLELTYPDGSPDAETLLVDPITLDLFVVTKYDDDDARSVYVKRAPHDDEGPFELEDLGSFDELELTATGGDVSADGSRIVVRDYSGTALMFFRDGYDPFEEAFEDDPCEVEIDDSSRGEGISFTWDGGGLVTVSEGEDVPFWLIEL